MTLHEAHGIALFSPTLPNAAGGSFIGYEGLSVAGTISGLTPHAWVDDAQGLFHTTTDLHAEWVGYYQQMIEGQGASLTPSERLEGQAEAVFLNTAINTLSAAVQNQFREDAQREIDAIGAAMQIDQQQYGIDPNAPLTETSYLALNHTIMGNAQLEELAVQGHGLNNPVLSRYDGYTNDFQKNVDESTNYTGPGPEKGDNALADYFDDSIMTHLCFSVVSRNGNLVQLNQNGTKESTLQRAVTEANLSMFGTTLTAKNFAA